MAFNGSYACTKCLRVHKKEELVVKKVMFQELGLSPRTVRSRSVAWLCASCVREDADWNRPPNFSPGSIAAGISNG